VISALRKADAGGAAVALAVPNYGLYPNACFLGDDRWQIKDVDLFLKIADQLFVALHGHWVGGGS
jgi:hypothetical protein